MSYLDCNINILVYILKIKNPNFAVLHCGLGVLDIKGCEAMPRNLFKFTIVRIF